MAALVRSHTMEQLRIAIIDDHPLICDGICTMLKEWSKGQVVLTAANGAEYERHLASVGTVDIALVDDCMPERDGYSTLDWMRSNQQQTLPILLTTDPTPDLISKAVHLGARGVLSKALHRAELLLALDQVSTMGFHMNEFMRSLLVGSSADRSAQPSARERVIRCLTRRELEVIEEICAHDDPPYNTVAERMGISENTVHTHRARIFNKLGVSNRQGLLRAALNWKILKRFQHAAGR